MSQHGFFLRDYKGGIRAVLCSPMFLLGNRFMIRIQLLYFASHCQALALFEKKKKKSLSRVLNLRQCAAVDKHLTWFSTRTL